MSKSESVSYESGCDCTSISRVRVSESGGGESESG